MGKSEDHERLFKAIFATNKDRAKHLLYALLTDAPIDTVGVSPVGLENLPFASVQPLLNVGLVKLRMLHNIKGYTYKVETVEEVINKLLERYNLQ